MSVKKEFTKDNLDDYFKELAKELLLLARTIAADLERMHRTWEVILG